MLIHLSHDFLCQGSSNRLEDPTILSGSLRSTLDVFEEYQDPDIVSCMPWCFIMILTVYISMRHSVVFISSHPTTPLPKHLTLSTLMFSGTWTRLCQKGVITFPQGQYFINQNLDFLSHYASCFLSEKQLLCMARAILKRSKVLVMDEVCHFVIYVPHCYRFWRHNKATARFEHFQFSRDMKTQRYNLQRWLCNRWTHWKGYPTVRPMIYFYH